jgi:hypothetical protein
VKEKVFFVCAQRVQQCSEAKKTIFWSTYGLPDFIFSFLGEVGTSTRKIIRMGGVNLCEKVHFVEGGVLKFISKGIIYTIN